MTNPYITREKLLDWYDATDRRVQRFHQFRTHANPDSQDPDRDMRTDADRANDVCPHCEGPIGRGLF